MYLSKRNGIYYVFYEKLDGKKTCKSTGTKLKSESLKFLTNFEKELESKPQQEIFFKDLIFQFLKHSESIHKWNHSKTLRVTLNQAIKYFGTLPSESFGYFRKKFASVL